MIFNILASSTYFSKKMDFTETSTSKEDDYIFQLKESTENMIINLELVVLKDCELKSISFNCNAVCDIYIGGALVHSALIKENENILPNKLLYNSLIYNHVKIVLHFKSHSSLLVMTVEKIFLYDLYNFSGEILWSNNKILRYGGGMAAITKGRVNEYTEDNFSRLQFQSYVVDSILTTLTTGTRFDKFTVGRRKINYVKSFDERSVLTEIHNNPSLVFGYIKMDNTFFEYIHKENIGKEENNALTNTTSNSIYCPIYRSDLSTNFKIYIPNNLIDKIYLFSRENKELSFIQCDNHVSITNFDFKMFFNTLGNPFHEIRFKIIFKNQVLQEEILSLLSNKQIKLEYDCVYINNREIRQRLVTMDNNIHILDIYPQYLCLFKKFIYKIKYKRIFMNFLQDCMHDWLWKVQKLI